MKLITELIVLSLLCLFFAVRLFAGEVRLAWDPSLSPGVTNYVVRAWTNSLASGNTNWVNHLAGTNITVKVTTTNSGRFYFHAVAVAGGAVSEPSNEIQVDFPAMPHSFRVVGVQHLVDFSATNQAAAFRLIFTP